MGKVILAKKYPVGSLLNMGGRTRRITKELCGRLFRKMFFPCPFFRNIRIILMYHRVLRDKPRGLHDPGLFVTAATFEMHLRELSRVWRIVPIEFMIRNGDGVDRCIAITFDDGWVDNYENAFPILLKYKVPATVFIPVAMIGSDEDFWFEKLYFLANQAVAFGIEREFIAYFQRRVPVWRRGDMNGCCVKDLASKLKSLPGEEIDRVVREAYITFGMTEPVQKGLVNWDQVCEMNHNGVSFGSHGLHHYILTRLETRDKVKEIQESLEVLKEKLGCTVPIFSYPNGDWDGESVAILKEKGYWGAVTTSLGCNTSGASRFILKRVGLHEYISDTPGLLWFRILQAIISGSKRKGNSGCSK